LLLFQSFHSHTPVSKAMLQALKTLMPDNKVKPHHDELWAETIRVLRVEWPNMRQALWEKHGPKCKVQAWDPDVYAGCLERIDRWFSWTDLHWGVEKAELVKRTEEWNAALEQYADDEGLTGETRVEVVEKHTANPLAPCGNIGCDVYETKIKEFQRCAGCRKIAYCSRKCQKGHWKQHKTVCSL
jgi:hypothetical protein